MGVIFLVSGVAVATPIFKGDPVVTEDNLDWRSNPNNEGDGFVPLSPEGPGYYIWANDEQRKSWSVRWAGMGETYNWAGEINFGGQLSNLSKVLWDAGDNGLQFDYAGLGGDPVGISFGPATAGTPNGWDGFDFELDASAPTLMTFILHSTYFAIGEEGHEKEGVYVGSGWLSVPENSDNPEGFFFRAGDDAEGFGSRQFEVYAPVPEPATILLFGAGLLGLAAYGRKKGFRLS